MSHKWVGSLSIKMGNPMASLRKGVVPVEGGIVFMGISHHVRGRRCRLKVS